MGQFCSGGYTDTVASAEAVPIRFLRDRRKGRSTGECQIMAEPRGSLGNYVDRLLAEVDSGRLELRFNLIGLNTPGQPTYSALNKNLAFLVPLLAAGICGVGLGWQIGLIAAAIGLLLFMTVGRRWVLSRAKARAVEILRADETTVLDFWQQRLFALHAVSSGAECLPPEGDWRAFIREQFLT